MEVRHVVHPFKPILDENSRVLVLGSIPSVASVREGFYYMHGRNRFWPLMSALLGVDLTAATAEAKAAALKSRGIALYDAVYECDIAGSSDGKVSNVKPSDIPSLIAGSEIKRVFCNGERSYKTVKKYFPDLSVEVIRLPSTSPANAAVSLDALITEWRKVLE